MDQFNILPKNIESSNNELKTESNQLKTEDKEFFKAIVENSTNFIAIVQDSQYVFVNSTGLSLLCCKSLADIIGKNVIETVHPDYQGCVVDYLAKESVMLKSSVHLKIIRL